VDTSAEQDAADAPSQRNLIDRTADRIDAFQRRVPPLAVTHAVLKKYGEDRGGVLAGLLAFRGFFSMFPLLLAFVNALGIALRNNPELRDRLIDSTLSNIPVIGSDLKSSAQPLDGSVWVLIGSVVVALWAGLGLLEVLQEALNTAWQVPMYERPPFLIRKLRDVPAALVVAACAVLSGAGTFLFTKDTGGVVRLLGSITFAVLAGALASFGLHQTLCARKVPFRAQLPGALAVGVGWWLLQALGTWYVNQIVQNSSDTYGVFVVVFGLMSWTYLLGQVYLYGTELAPVLHDHRWPRSMSGRDLTDVDHAALASAMARETRVRGTEINVSIPRNPESPS